MRSNEPLGFLHDGDIIVEQRKRLILRLLVGLVTIVVVLLLVSRALNVSLLREVSRLSLDEVLLFLALFVMAESLRAWRLKLIVSTLGPSPGMLKALGSRLLGDVVSSLTPSVAGGEALRGVIAGGDLSLSYATAGILDGVFDLYANYVYAILLAPLALKVSYFYTTLALILGGLAVSFWCIALGFTKLHDIAKRIIPRRFSGLLEIPSTLRRLSTILWGVKFTAIISISLVSWLLQCLQYYVVCMNHCGGANLLRVVMAYTYSSLMGLIPLPGGVGVFELAASSYTCPEAAISWRLLWLIAITFSALLGSILSLSTL